MPTPLTLTRSLCISSLLWAACFNAGCDDDESPSSDSETPPTEEDPSTEPGEGEEEGLTLAAENYQDFLNIALKTRPVLAFDGYPVALFETFTLIDDIETVDETTTITHRCDGAIGSGITTQYIQAVADGEEEPLYGTAGDYKESVLANCSRSGFIHSGTLNNALTTHTEYAEPDNLSSTLTFTLADSVQTQTYTNYVLENVSTGETVSISGSQVKTLRYESEAEFNMPGNRNPVQYLDQLASATLTLQTDFATGTNLDQQFANYVEVETDDTLQWSGTITTLENEQTYSYTIAMPSALTKTATANSYAAGQLIITQDTIVLTAQLSDSNQAAITLDLEGDGVFELEETITLSP